MRLRFTLILLLIVAAPLALIPDSTLAAGTNEIISPGAQPFHFSNVGQMSADGRFVSFYSISPHLAPGDVQMCGSSSCKDVFVRDRLTQITTLVSRSSAGVQGNADSDAAAMNADGRYVAFSSAASNLVAGDTNNSNDIFIHDRQTATTSRMSVDSAGGQANNGSFLPAVNAGGRFVAFYSNADNLVAGDTAMCGGVNCGDVFVHDRQTGVTSMVSVSSAGVQANSSSSLSVPSLSADGRYVTFASLASNLIAGDTNSVADVFVHDRQTAMTTRVSLSGAGIQGNAESTVSAINSDGRYVVFQSRASNLVPGDTQMCSGPPAPHNCDDVFVHDRLSGATTRVSVSSSGGQGNFGGTRGTISNDGRFVAFASNSTNLVAGDTNNWGDGFIHDRLTGATIRFSLDNSGNQANGNSFPGDFDGTSRLIAFDSSASNLVTGDVNGNTDVFVHDLGDADSDFEWDPFDPCSMDPDCDDDSFGDGTERTIGTNPLLDCGTGAWPADINNDTFADITDVSAITGVFGAQVPPAPARYDIAPDTPDGFVDITDVSRMTGLFGQSCAP